MASWKDTIKPIENGANPVEAKSWKSTIIPIKRDNEVDLSQDIGDTAKGIAQGATLGFGDEILGAAQATGDVLTGKSNLDQLAKLFREHQKENETSYDEAKKRSPWLTTGGELAGGLALGTGPLGVLGKGGTLLESAVTGAGMGALSGIGGSRQNMDNPEALAKDAINNAELGAAFGAGMHGLGKAGGAVKEAIKDSPFAQKLGYIWDSVKNGGQSFSGKKAGLQIQDDVDTAAKSVSKQLMEPLIDSGKFYGQALDDAADSGATLNVNDPEFMKKLAAARELISGKNATPGSPIIKNNVSQSSEFNPVTMNQDSVIKSTPQVMGMTGGTPGSGGRGGLSPEMEELLNKHGASYTDPVSLNTVTQSLNPREAKSLQLAIRDLKNKPSFKDTEVLNELDKALTKGIGESLPEGELAKINNIFSQAHQAIEPVLNKGEIEDQFRPKSVSDINGDLLAPKIQDYIKKLIEHGETSNLQGDKSASALTKIIQSLKDKNAQNQIAFTNPEQIAKQVQDASMKSAIRRGMVGEKTSENTGFLKNIGDAIAGTPYRATELAAKGAKSLQRQAESTGLPQLSKKLYTASDDALRNAASSLEKAGFGYMGRSLSKALDSKSDTAKNAAMFTIMQNPAAREAVFGPIDVEKDIENRPAQ